MLDEKTKSELCIKCGNCCKFFLLTIPKPPPNLIKDGRIQTNFSETFKMRQWMEARGIKIVKEMDKWWRIRIDHQCPHLFSPNPQSFYCDIYDHRPLVCREFDGRIQSDGGLICLWKER